MKNKIQQISSRDLDVAREVLSREIEGIQALSDALDAKFVHAVEIIAGLKGRLIISGMGKSGHVARKIAATMASTGTPAYFVHPGEASHGDLGMITPQDGLLMLSNSGETIELKDMIAYARRFSIPLIAMVRRKTSVLVDAADVALVLPEIPEASPVNAPTTSTTMMLALGDALAVALLERRGFGKEEFNVFHPGGSLGAQFLHVKDLMHAGDAVPLVHATQPMSEVLLVMTAKSFGCAGVLNADGTLAGVITDGDLRRHIDGDLMKHQAQEVMTKNPVTTGHKALAAEALGVMNSKKITSLFVVDGAHKPVGIVHIHDCLRAGVM
ncbi:MAG: KpsF/GutQ family sugar-phosphate isomerase [Alphaproteobacteria bacterium]|nr:KpsF/GutQ family sugar-phosphate isomerase [Alphaproteobacteria bacterium]